MTNHPDEIEFWGESPYDQDSPIYSADPMEEELMIEWNSQYDYVREANWATAQGLEDDCDYDEYEDQPPILHGPAFDVWHCWVNDRGAEVIPF